MALYLNSTFYIHVSVFRKMMISVENKLALTNKISILIQIISL